VKGDRSIPWGKYLDKIIGIGMFSSLFAALGGVIWSLSTSDYEERAIQNFDKDFQLDDLSGEEYKIASGSVVVLNNGGLQYSFDFASKMVALDGPDKADRVFQFGEYEEPEMIEQARNVGCEIARNIPQALADFQTENGEGHPDAKDMVAASASFIHNVCKQAL